MLTLYCFSVAGLCILVYDYLLTLDLELAFFWPVHPIKAFFEFSALRALFFLVRIVPSCNYNLSYRLRRLESLPAYSHPALPRHWCVALTSAIHPQHLLTLSFSGLTYSHVSDRVSLVTFRCVFRVMVD